ncbi:GntR family transcriptional regulator [Amnibacterium sp. CER49]|uniref:GntR family transcriptional regulator n=1 Tax=Amnibacterium sp. CER49 TaxID=3039161 RepID=UPI002447EC1E|nr:GntR family transcriptional regulator [Amnibacterium sp. CER49]MDH2443375.1 GntR family transcriptional regulator [Amnibacterium sp. CER49]
MTASRDTAVLRVAAELRSEILSGRIALGSPLREEPLAARFGVSRHTVRTALANLAGTGLVRTAPFVGARVPPFDEAEAAALQDLRRALESEAADLLHRRYGGAPWPQAVLAPIDAALGRLRAAERDGDEAETLQAHSAVHRALVAAAGSPRITRAHEQLSDELSLLLLHARPRYGAGELERQHRALLADVQRLGAPPVREHLDDTLERLGIPRQA